MNSTSRARAAIATGACILVTIPALAGSAGASGGSLPPTPGFTTAPPGGATGPDDLTRLAVEGVDGGRPVLWTAFQNGAPADGSAPANSTVTGYDEATGNLVETVSVPGKVDGLTADAENGRLIATVNEDANSSLFTIDPARNHPLRHYSYSANLNDGGTDSVAVRGEHIYVVHSNPGDSSQPAQYEVTLTGTTANLAPLYADNSAATDAVTGAPTTLNLGDPDTNYVMPAASPRFAGELALISQGDGNEGQIVFGSRPGSLSVLHVQGTPPLDGIAVATADHGTLFMVDKGAQPVRAFDTAGFPAGTVFATEDNHGTPTLGTLDLTNGQFASLGVPVSNPKGLVFVPSRSGDEQQNESGDPQQGSDGSSQSGSQSGQD